MLGRRRRRWPSIYQALGRCLGFAGTPVIYTFNTASHPIITRPLPDDVLMLAQHLRRWLIIKPTLFKRLLLAEQYCFNTRLDNPAGGIIYNNWSEIRTFMSSLQMTVIIGIYGAKYCLYVFLRFVLYIFNFEQFLLIDHVSSLTCWKAGRLTRYGNKKFKIPDIIG